MQRRIGGARQAGLSSGDLALARNRRSVKFDISSDSADQSQPSTTFSPVTSASGAGEPRQETRQVAPAQAVRASGAKPSGSSQLAEQNLSLKHRAGLLHRPPPMHMKSSYQHEYGENAGQPAGKTPILEANRALMRDGQGPVSNAFASDPVPMPFQAATEYQRTYQPWALPAAQTHLSPPAAQPAGVKLEPQLQVEDISDSDEEDDAAVRPAASPPPEEDEGEWEYYPGCFKKNEPLPQAPDQVSRQGKPGVPSAPQSEPSQSKNAPPAQTKSTKTKSHPPTQRQPSQPKQALPSQLPVVQPIVPANPARMTSSHNPSLPAQQLPLQNPSNQSPDVSPMTKRERSRRFKTEYQRTFCDPVESHLVVAHPAGGTGLPTSAARNSPVWYDQVLELRSKAERYRARSLGTFFSRSYFDQLEDALAGWETDSSAGTARSHGPQSPPPVLPADGQQPEAGSNGPNAGAASSAPQMLPTEMPTAGQPGPQDTASVASTVASTPPIPQPPQPAPSLSHTLHQTSPSTASIASTSSVASVGSARSQTSSVASSQVSEAGGRVSTPNLPRHHIRHHLDRTTPGRDGVLLESPARSRSKTGHLSAHGRPVTDPTIRENPKPAPGMGAKPSAVTKASGLRAGTGARATKKSQARHDARSKPAACTCGAEIGPGPYHYRIQPPLNKPRSVGYQTRVIASQPVPSLSVPNQSQASRKRMQSSDQAAQRTAPGNATHSSAAPALARSRVPLCDSLSSLSSQGSAANEVLSRAKQRRDQFWTQ